MSLTPSTMLELGTTAADFDLLDVDGKHKTLADFADARALVVVFMCNHCPYVKHVLPQFIEFAREYIDKNVAIIGISSNSVESHPQDGPEAMRELAQSAKFPFSYLYDASQEVAKAYRAACTPDLFLFDADRNLVYRGQFDDSRPGNNIPVTGQDLRHALDALLAGKPVEGEQKPSMGCNIKWKPGFEPDYI